MDNFDLYFLRIYSVFGAKMCTQNVLGQLMYLLHSNLQNFRLWPSRYFVPKIAKAIKKSIFRLYIFSRAFYHQNMYVLTCS